VKVDIDLSELTDLAQTLTRDVPQRAVAAGRRVTQAEARLVKARAQAAAPRGRPWLATSGIRMKSFTNKGNIATNVFTVPDPEGRDVGFYEEYGTSRNPPHAFMAAAIAPAEASYPAAVLAAVDPFGAGSGGDAGGGDE